MPSSSAVNKRLDWIDWMKTIGIYFIVLGHFFSIGHKFIYVFNVPLFFLISGFLCKKEKNCKLFWNKLLYNLIIPMIIISTIIFLCRSAVSLRNETFEIISVISFLKNMLFGYFDGVQACWFVYTLSIIKVIYHYCSRKSMFYVIGIICLICAYVYNKIDLYDSKISNSIVNVCTAYPFFAIGVFLGNYKEQISKIQNYYILGFTLICSMVLVYLSAKHNDYVWMYICYYGDNMFWFLTGGISGSISVFVFSKILGHATILVEKISKGTILILGFHFYIIPMFRCFSPNTFFDFLSAFILVILFIPIIILTEKHFPLLLGKYRFKKIGR